jgi:hypothetical protein
MCLTLRTQCIAPPTRRANYSNTANAPIFRFTLVNPVNLPTGAQLGEAGRVEFVW